MSRCFSLTRALLLPGIMLLTTGGGCIHSSRVKQVPLQPPGTFGAAPGAGEAKASGRWWLLFGDTQLNGLIDRALSHNLDLELASARVEQARASLMLAGAGWYPRVTAKGEVGVSQSSMQLPALAPGGEETSKEFTRESYSLSLGVSYEVDLWGKVRFGHKAAKKDLEATEQDLQAARISIAAQLADAYYLAVELRSQMRLLDQTIKNRESHVKLARRRYLEGMVTALDIYQAEEAAARARAQRTSHARRLRTTEHAVAVLAGRFPRGGVTGTLDHLPRGVRAIPPGLPAQLLLRRPDLRAAHARLLAADSRVGQAVAGHYPSLTLSASVGTSFDPTSLLWSLLAGLTAPIFEGFRVKAKVKQSEALLKIQLVTYKSTLLKAVREVEDALVSGESLQRRVTLLERRVDASQKVLRLSTEQYMQGLVPYLTVLTAQNSFYSARSELISARRELISARIQLARALGGGWAASKKPRSNTSSGGKDAG